MVQPAGKESVMMVLKRETSQNHRDLEQAILPHLNALRGVPDYSCLLKAFYGYFHPMERQIERVLTIHNLPDLPHRRKAAFILKDLKSLNEPAGPLPEATDLPLLPTEATALGALYVLEGSTLGGRAITKMILKSLPSLTLSNLQFFNGYGENTGLMWTRFQESLNTFALQPGHEVEMVAAANETFLKFELWIKQTLK